MDASTVKLIHIILRDAVAYVSQAWSVTGPLFGVLVGGYLSTSAQSRKWLADNKKEEYRALLEALLVSFEQLYRVDRRQDEFNYTHHIETLELVAERTILNQIFISADLENLKLWDRWKDMVTKLRDTRKEGAFFDDFMALRKDIVHYATRTEKLVKFWSWHRV